MITIGITGRAGAGKDTVADMAGERWPIACMAMADALRDECAAAWGVDSRVFRDRRVKEVPMLQLRIDACREPGFVKFAWHLPVFGSLKPRTVMQAWGDWRRAQDPDYFLAAASIFRGRALGDGVQIMLVTDIRFPNEHAWLKDRDGCLVRVQRPGLAPVSSHESEWRLDGVPADFVIVNDGDLDALRARVHAVFAEIIIDPFATEAA